MSNPENKPSGSGKQVLLKIIQDLSTRVVDPADEEDATDHIRTGILMHGSTADESHEHVSRLKWGADVSRSGSMRQGLALKSNGLLVSDIFDAILMSPTTQEAVLAEFPDLSEEDYEAAMHGLWAIVTAAQMFEELRSVETDWSKLPVEQHVEVFMRHHRSYMENKEEDSDSK